MASTTTDQPPARDLEPADAPPARATYAFVLTVFGLFGVIALVVALLIGTGKNDGTSAGTSAPAAVTLSDFAISPSSIDATNGAGIHVTNNGKVPHNFAIEGTSYASAMIDPGKSAHLDIAGLAPGDYTVICQVPGHKELGMTAKLHVTAGQGEVAAGGTAGTGTDMSTSSMTPEQMDKAMQDSIGAFPAKTEGVGGQLLEPTVLPDGTKQFELTTAVTKWEVSPGKVVDAMTYNGTVPGPTIKVDPGDHVKVVLHNRMEQSTSIHFHGLLTPNSMDGTTIVTQPPVKSGEDFTYEWTVQSTPAVGMYHSHHNAVEQVPDGLAGAFLVGEMPTPAGTAVAQEQIMMLDDSGVISYALNGKSFPATAPITAAQGDWVEVHYLNEGTQIHPMHLHGMPQLVIAKDGFSLPNPQLEDTVTVAPGERYTVLIHATEPGVWVWHCHILPHAENADGMFGMVTALIVN